MEVQRNEGGIVVVRGKEGSTVEVRLGRPRDLERMRHLEENKRKILADYDQLGRIEAFKKWGISGYWWKKLQANAYAGQAAIHGGNVCGHGGNGNGNGNGNGDNHNGNGHNGNGNGSVLRGGHGLENTAILSLTRDGRIPAMIAPDRIAELLRKMAESEGPSDLARGLRLAATLVESAGMLVADRAMSSG